MKRNGYTLIELLAVIFVMFATILAWRSVSSSYGLWWGIGAGFLAAGLSIILVINFYRWSWRKEESKLVELREKYTAIYRVNTIPSDLHIIIKPEGAEIRLGDFGWEAGPIRDDRLIYLQGLTPEWTVVWHAGFHPDEIEKVAEKPNSQYDSWYPYWANSPSLPPCPYPVIERETMTIGHPHHSHKYFVNPTLYHPGQLQRTSTGKPSNKGVERTR